MDLTLGLNEKINIKGTSFSVALFNVGNGNETINQNYECLIESLLYTPMIHETEKHCNISFKPCPLEFLDQSDQMLYSDCNSSTYMKFTFY